MASTNKVNFPTITLDFTLSDLYKQHCRSLSEKRLAHVFCGTTCASDLSLDFPKNKKYIYQDGSFNDPSRSQIPDDEVQRTLAPKYLSLIPQRDAFIAGKTPVIFFYSGSEKADREHDERETEKTLSVLDDSQRPEAIFCPGPKDTGRVCADHGIDALTSKLVVDDIAEPPDGSKTMMITDAEKLWFVNGKEALAISGLPTPPSEIVEVQGHCPDASRCCEVCEQAGGIEVPEGCMGPRLRWIGEQTIRILSAIERQKLPFVFKNQQAFAGAGTYVITKGHERNQLLQDMTAGGILKRMLCYITSENEHLRPGTVLLMSMVKDPINDIGITFFVTESGEAIFLAASEQMIDRNTAAWIGSTIDYDHQDGLKNKFRSLIDRVAVWLHKQSYVGPAGADILETKDGEFHIVDLNVRTSGSLCLPLMQTHFTSRGFNSASSLSITVKQSREEFCEHWRKEIEAGQLCIVAWYEDDHAGKSFGDVVVGAEDEDHLAEMLGRVRDVTEQVTF